MNRPTQYVNSQFQSDENAVRFQETFSDFFPAIIFVYDVTCKRITYLNNKVADLLGYTLEDFDNAEDPLSTLVFKEDLALAMNEIQKMMFLKDRESHSFVLRLNHFTESFRSFKNVGRVFRRDDDGNPVSLICIAEDITEQLRMEEEAMATRQLFDETEKLLHMGTWSWSPFTNVLEWTDGIYSVLEYDRADVKEDLISFFNRHIASEHTGTFENYLQEATQQHKAMEVEFVVRTKSGKEKIIYVKGEVIFDASNDLKRIIGIARDITVKKNSEKARERIIRDLNRSNKELEEFAYVASHDMHEPIRKILTFCERIKTRHMGGLGEEGAIYIERISSSADNMRALIDNLLEFSRVTKSSRSFATCDLNDIIKNVLSDQELRIEETSTEVRIKSLPVVQCVAPEMRQLFNNLIGNALKFQRKGVPPVISISCKTLGHKEKSEHLLPFDQTYYQVNVQDNGIGFEPRYGEKIFEIFQRLHGKAEYSGTGIGLAICKKIVENHEGIIFATGEPGEGSVFSIILPESQFQ
jgi:PAS domain S-box-containing protein